MKVQILEIEKMFFRRKCNFFELFFISGYLKPFNHSFLILYFSSQHLFHNLQQNNLIPDVTF
jgi:hypothetical protein